VLIVLIVVIFTLRIRVLLDFSTVLFVLRSTLAIFILPIIVRFGSISGIVFVVRRMQAKMRFWAMIPAAGSSAAVLEDFEAFTRDAHVANLDFRAQGDNIDNLEGEFAWVNVGAVDVVGQEGDAEGAEMGN
jgi:hypothetical protein